MTAIRAQLGFGQSIGPASFVDLTDAEVEVRFGDGGLLEVTLTPDVSGEVAAAVRCRVISQGPEDEAVRREIAGLLAEEPGPGRTAALVEALGRLAVLVP
ncbi:hypothetical protein [Nocardioides soli]|uniref:Uncharacterized protein n=1 Tax=Nocardioides soli TaxID=1036020 RepID=A0A7W4VT38_9ACTN|nr:hypothetical protein [Nocardioides soli]MBB3041229.1 hypothetical protein [Nocardioides soli]